MKKTQSIESKSTKICLISSHGGHLRELLSATKNVIGTKYYVTCKTAHTLQLLQSSHHYFVVDPHTSFFKYLLNCLESLRHIYRERPYAVVSTGSGIAIPTIFICKFMLKAKVIFIESAANVYTPSKTGRFIYKWADLFLIQWPTLKRYYPKSICVGLL